MASKKKSPSQKRNSRKYWLGIAAAQERARYIVETNASRNGWASEHEHRKYRDEERGES